MTGKDSPDRKQSVKIGVLLYGLPIGLVFPFVLLLATNGVSGFQWRIALMTLPISLALWMMGGYVLGLVLWKYGRTKSQSQEQARRVASRWAGISFFLFTAFAIFAFTSGSPFLGAIHTILGLFEGSLWLYQRYKPSNT